VRERPAAGHVHHSRELNKAALHEDVGRLQRPDLVSAADGLLAQQVGVDLLAWVAHAGAGLRAPGLDAMRCMSVPM